MSNSTRRFMKALAGSWLAALALCPLAAQARVQAYDYYYPPGLTVLAVIGKGTTLRPGTKLHGTVMKSDKAGVKLRTDDNKIYLLKWGHVKIFLEMAQGEAVIMVMGKGAPVEPGTKLSGTVTKLDKQGLGLKTDDGKEYQLPWDQVRNISKGAPSGEAALPGYDPATSRQLLPTLQPQAQASAAQPAPDNGSAPGGDGKNQK